VSCACATGGGIRHHENGSLQLYCSGERAVAFALYRRPRVVASGLECRYETPAHGSGGATAQSAEVHGGSVTTVAKTTGSTTRSEVRDIGPSVLYGRWMSCR
jgi:hypothetical protein